MKKYLKLVLVFIFVFALTGCVKYDMEMEIKEDKSVNFELIYAIDYSIMDQFENMEVEETNEADEENEVAMADEEPLLTTGEEDLTAEENEEEGINVKDYEFLTKKGYKVEEYKDESDNKKLAGIKISKTFKSIDDITKETEKTININEIFKDEEHFDDSQFFSKKGSTYKASLLFDFTEEKSEDSQSMNMGSLKDSFELKYVIKLPVKAKTNNATEVSEDGKTLTWKFKYGEKNTVEYSFALSNGLFGLSNEMLMYIGIGLAVVLVVVVVVVVSKKKKVELPVEDTSKDNSENNL